MTSKIEGKVFVSFVVNEKGKVTQAKIVKGTNELLDKEALRVINKMPKMIPGKQNGKEIHVRYTISITFKYEE